ncbi:MAG: hypothetical protein JSV81_07025 [Anaerolineales bacterium]|nr:MAG: hypothetical protein JSV81_07025 [Anaerolineales bacterium]
MITTIEAIITAIVVTVVAAMAAVVVVRAIISRIVILLAVIVYEIVRAVGVIVLIAVVLIVIRAINVVAIIVVRAVNVIAIVIVGAVYVAALIIAGAVSAVILIVVRAVCVDTIEVINHIRCGVCIVTGAAGVGDSNRYVVLVTVVYIITIVVTLVYLGWLLHLIRRSIFYRFVLGALANDRLLNLIIFEVDGGHLSAFRALKSTGGFLGHFLDRVEEHARFARGSSHGDAAAQQ